MERTPPNLPRSFSDVRGPASDTKSSSPVRSDTPSEVNHNGRSVRLVGNSPETAQGAPAYSKLHGGDGKHHVDDAQLSDAPLKGRNPSVSPQVAKESKVAPDVGWWPHSEKASMFRGLIEFAKLFDPRDELDMGADARMKRFLEGERGAGLDAPDEETERQEAAQLAALLEKLNSRTEEQANTDRAWRAGQIHQALYTDKPHENPKVLEDLLEYLTKEVEIWPVGGLLEEMATVALEDVLGEEIGSPRYVEQLDAIGKHLVSASESLEGTWRYEKVCDAFYALLVKHQAIARGSNE